MKLNEKTGPDWRVAMYPVRVVLHFHCPLSFFVEATDVRLSYLPLRLPQISVLVVLLNMFETSPSCCSTSYWLPVNSYMYVYFIRKVVNLHAPCTMHVPLYAKAFPVCACVCVCFKDQL